MLLGRDLVPNHNYFHNVVACTIGDGRSLLFWPNRWLGSKPLKEVFPALFAISSQKDEFVGKVGFWELGRWM